MEMRMDADRRPGRSLTAMKTWSLGMVALTGALALAACGGGGGGPVRPPGGETPPPAGEPGPALVSGLYFDYTLEREGETPIEEVGSVPLSCPAGGCTADDLQLLFGTSGAGMRGGFGAAAGTTGGPPRTESFSGASAIVTGATFMRYGFWGDHGYGAVEIGAGALEAEDGGQEWSGRFRAAHAWTAGEPSATNPAGTGSAAWRGIAEAARTADFVRLMGTAELRIADLAQPLRRAPLRWSHFVGQVWGKNKVYSG